MSNSSIDRTHSPTIEPAEEQRDGSVQPPPKRTMADTQGEQPPITVPFDQDLFDSRPPSQSAIPQQPNDPDQKAHEDQGEQEGQDEPEETFYPAPTSDEALVHPPDFKPFFTLVASGPGGSGEYSHPAVHYLFSDDDEEILTSAALHSLQQSSPLTHTSGAREECHIQDDHEDGDGGEQDVEERVVILDISPDGRSVANVSSLSPRWQAIRTDVGPAPSMGGSSGGAGEGEQTGEKGLMLRISGAEREELGEVGGGGMEELIARFEDKVGMLGEAMGRDRDGQEEGTRGLGRGDGAGE